MKIFAKAALGALMLSGAMALPVSPAAAHVSIGIGLGGYGYYPPPYYAYCDPHSRWFDPYRCDDYGPGYDSYSGPVFIDGFWFNGPFRSRFFDGRREFFFHDGWHGGTGFRNDGFSSHGGFRGTSHGDFHGGGHRH